MTCICGDDHTGECPCGCPYPEYDDGELDPEPLWGSSGYGSYHSPTAAMNWNPSQEQPTLKDGRKI